MGSAPCRRSCGPCESELSWGKHHEWLWNDRSGPVVFGARDRIAPPPASVGWVIPGVGAKLIDASGTRRIKENFGINAGELAGLSESTRQNCEPTKDGWYKTGDIFRRDIDGAHYFVGRTDDMFNCGGENIYPADVEAILVSHPDIDQACVVPVPDEIKGMKPVAFAVLGSVDPSTRTRSRNTRLLTGLPIGTPACHGDEGATISRSG